MVGLRANLTTVIAAVQFAKTSTSDPTDIQVHFSCTYIYVHFSPLVPHVAIALVIEETGKHRADADRSQGQRHQPHQHLIGELSPSLA